MGMSARNIVLLAGRLGAHDARTTLGLAERLGAPGLSAEVVCLSGASGPRAVECPGLGRAWRRSWAVGHLRLAGGPIRPDLLHALGPEMAAPAIALAERWQVPYVLTIREFLPTGGRLRLSGRWCRALVATGRDLAEDLIVRMGVPESWVAVVPPGIELPELTAKVGGAGVPVVGAAGPLVDGSGLATFLGAARRVVDAGVDAEFVVAGQGREEGDLRRRAERLGVADRVTFAGDPGRDGPFWRVLDVFCQTALGPDTGRPLATALARGIPAVASDVPGLRALLADGTVGRLVPPSEPKALADEILALLADPALAAELGGRARRRMAEEFDPAREAGDLAALYRRVIDASEASETGLAEAAMTLRS